MGNNIKQKNLAFSFEKKTGIPYGDLKYVSLDDNRSVDNSLNVNNTTEQLVDNDIFIENQINFNKNRRVGPKSGDEESIYNGPDGYKYWDKEGGSFDIYHKKDHDVQSTFRRLSEFTSVNLLVKINDSSVLVCENGKTSVGNLDFRDMSFQRVTYAQHDVTVRCKSQVGNTVFMGCTIHDGSNNRYCIMTVVQEHQTDQNGEFVVVDNQYIWKYSFNKVVDVDGTPIAIEFSPELRRVACSTDEYFYVFGLNDQNGYEVTHDRLRLYGNDIIRSVAFTDYEKSGLSKDEMIIAADGNRNMLISGRGTTLCDFGRVNGCSRINGCFTIANDTYLLTDKGVVCNGEVVGQERNAVKYYRISARRYLVLFDQTNESSAIGEVCIVENGQSNCVSYVKDNVSGRILDFCGDNNKLVIVTEDNIYVSSYDSVWYPVIGTTSDEEDETPQENTIIVDSICRTLDSGSQETELGVYVITKHIPVSQDDGDEIYHTIDCYPITNITIEYSQEGCEIPGTKDFSTEFPEFVPGIPIQFGGEVITLTSIQYQSGRTRYDFHTTSGGLLSVHTSMNLGAYRGYFCSNDLLIVMFGQKFIYLTANDTSDDDRHSLRGFGHGIGSYEQCQGLMGQVAENPLYGFTELDSSIVEEMFEDDIGDAYRNVFILKMKSKTCIIEAIYDTDDLTLAERDAIDNNGFTSTEYCDFLPFGESGFITSTNGSRIQKIEVGKWIKKFGEEQLDDGLSQFDHNLEKIIPLYMESNAIYNEDGTQIVGETPLSAHYIYVKYDNSGNPTVTYAKSVQGEERNAQDEDGDAQGEDEDTYDKEEVQLTDIKAIDFGNRSEADSIFAMCISADASSTDKIVLVCPNVNDAYVKTMISTSIGNQNEVSKELMTGILGKLFVECAEYDDNGNLTSNSFNGDKFNHYVIEGDASVNEIKFGNIGWNVVATEGGTDDDEQIFQVHAIYSIYGGGSIKVCVRNLFTIKQRPDAGDTYTFEFNVPDNIEDTTITIDDPGIEHRFVCNIADVIENFEILVAKNDISDTNKINIYKYTYNPDYNPDDDPNNDTPKFTRQDVNIPEIQSDLFQRLIFDPIENQFMVLQNNGYIVLSDAESPTTVLTDFQIKNRIFVHYSDADEETDNYDNFIQMVLGESYEYGCLYVTDSNLGELVEAHMGVGIIGGSYGDTGINVVDEMACQKIDVLGDSDNKFMSVLSNYKKTATIIADDTRIASITPSDIDEVFGEQFDYFIPYDASVTDDEGQKNISPLRAIFGISGKHYVLDTTLGENGKQEIILPEAPRMVLTGEWMYETVTDYNGQFFIPMIVLGTQDYPYFRTLSYKGTAQIGLDPDEAFTSDHIESKVQDFHEIVMAMSNNRTIYIFDQGVAANWGMCVLEDGGSFSDWHSLDADGVYIPNKTYGITGDFEYLISRVDQDGIRKLYAKRGTRHVEINHPNVQNIQFGDMFYTNKTFYVNCIDAGESSSFSFSGVKKNQIYFTRTNTVLNGNDGEIVKSLIKTGTNEFIIGSNQFIYNYQIEKMDGDILDWQYSTYSSRHNNMNSYGKFMVNNLTYYYASDGNEILSSSNTRSWRHMYYVGAGTADNVMVNDFMWYNNHDLMGSKGGNLWVTEYGYDLENDTPDFTQDDAFKLYTEHLSSIDSRIDTTINNEHIVKEHSGTSPIDRLSRYTTTKFEVVGDVTQTEIESDNVPVGISSDYVYKIMTESDAGKDVVNAFVKNTALGNNEEDAKWKSVPCNFIAKVWKSGMVDLYVYLQTTNTYYIPHMKYAGNCQSSDDFTVKVNGRDLKTNIRDNYTTIKLTILDTVFDIDSVFENTIKGNSLPLKVFKLNDDLTDAEEEKAKMYHSYVQPSVAMAEEIRPVQYDRYQMMYYCFGSDAQAIKITFFDSKQNYDLPYKSVVYHGNGGYSIFDGRDTVTQRIIQGDGEKELYSDGMCFDNGDAIFVGWSVSRKGEIGDVIDFNTIDYDDITGKSLHLYAVWNRYRFGNMDTQLTIDTEEGETYTISEMEVDPNAQPGNGNQKLGNHIIMDWDN